MGYLFVSLAFGVAFVTVEGVNPLDEKCMNYMTTSEAFSSFSVMCDDVKKLSIMLHHHRPRI